MRIIHKLTDTINPVLIVLSKHDENWSILWYFDREYVKSAYEKDEEYDVGAWHVKYKTQ